MMIVKPRFHRQFLFIFGLLVLFSGLIPASWAAEANESRWQFSIGLGFGVRTNPVMDNDNIPLIVLPQLSYQGERFFIQNLDFGYALFQKDAQQLNLLLTPSYDQIFFNEWDVSNYINQSTLASAAVADKSSPSLESTNNRAIDKSRLHDRHMAALAGAEYRHNFYDVDFQVQVLREVTGYYDGSELRFALSKNISTGKHDVKLTAGANWQSAVTINYFYGLPEAESPGNYAYKADAGVTGLLRFDWSYQLDEHWSLRFFTSYRHLSHSISNSPLVTQNNVITAFAGGVYHF